MHDFSFPMASMKLISNSPFWESSKRPLHPKCVWVELMTGPTNSGFRHFIFDYSLSNSCRFQHETQLDNSKIHADLEKSQCFHGIEKHVKDMSVVGSADKVRMDGSPGAHTIINPKFENKLVEPLNNSGKELELVKSVHMLMETPSTPGMIRLSNIINSSKNLLAERVLQWLDLAGGRDTSSKNSNKNHLNTFKSRSPAANETQKLFESQKDVFEKPKACRELVHQLSMTFNKGNADSSNKKNSPTFSRKVLSFRKMKNTPDEVDPLVLQPWLRLKSSKKSTSIKNSNSKPKRFEYFEDQYQSIIQRQILESSCKTQLAKRQLHIFMPNLPKRCLIVSETNLNLPQIISPKSVK